MRTIARPKHSLLPFVVASFLGFAGPGSLSARAGDAPASKVTVLATQELPNVPGKSMTVVIVDYPPGGSSVPHHHAGSVFAYVLAGAVKSQITGGELTIYRAGESFFEPPGSHHLVSANASADEAARLLAVIIADTGAQLTTADPK